MQPGLMALLLFGIVNATIEPQGRDYMLELLKHQRFIFMLIAYCNRNFFPLSIHLNVVTEDTWKGK